MKTNGLRVDGRAKHPSNGFRDSARRSSVLTGARARFFDREHRADLVVGRCPARDGASRPSAAGAARIGLVHAWIVALLLLLAACHPLAFAVDPAFSQSQRDEIARAALDWNTRTKPNHRLTFDGDSWHFLAQTPPDGLGYNGLTRGSVRTIWCRTPPLGATVYDVALHEFGHALGLGHTTTGVMMATTVSDEFTPEVMAECRRVGACE